MIETANGDAILSPDEALDAVESRYPELASDHGCFVTRRDDGKIDSRGTVTLVEVAASKEGRLTGGAARIVASPASESIRVVLKHLGERHD